MQPCRDPQVILAQTSLVPSFLEFVQIDTQSDATSDANPSTAKQLNLQKVLQKKLAALGGENVRLDDKGYLYASFPGNAPKAPAFGLMAHVDTAGDFSGTNVRPRLCEGYDGKPIVLPGGVVISPDDTPELKECRGDTIITASGDTLLGADDKAGVAEVIATLEFFQKHPELKRPTLRIAFTPDEEIGRGAEFFDVPGFQAAWAYTVDGGFAGEVNFETFSADKAVVTFTGVAVHPGTAKGKLVNAIRWLGRFVDQLPKAESPEQTEDREGFFHPTGISGNAAEAKVEMILRDFDTAALKVRGGRLRALAEEFVTLEPRLKANVEITAQYRNMADELQKHPRTRDLLLKAVRSAGLEPHTVAIRGGTDGSGLTAMGLPTPNIFTGGVNFHGPREWVSTRVMALAVCTIVNLAQLFAEEA
jgi:tripeptide aminopeptidase